MNRVTQQELISLIDYNEFSGSFTWKNRPLEAFKTKRAFSTWNARYAGRSAGHLNRISGYVEISVMGVSDYAHRWAWLYVNGDIPSFDIDHINHNRADNRFCNLRHATDSENQQNQKLSKANSSGTTGVSWSARRSAWIVQAMYCGKSVYGGQFQCIEQAKAKRELLNKELGFHQNHGLPLAG